MKHLKLNLLEGSNLIGTAGHDEFILRAGDGTEVVSGFDPAKDYVLFDSKTGVWDGLLGAFQNGPYLADGNTFTNSHGTASWTVHALDYNNDGVTDTAIVMGDDQIVLLGLSPDQIPYSDILGG